MTAAAAIVVLAYAIALLVRAWLRIRRTRKRIAGMLEARRHNYSADMQRIMGKAPRAGNVLPFNARRYRK